MIARDITSRLNRSSSSEGRALQVSASKYFRLQFQSVLDLEISPGHARRKMWYAAGMRIRPSNDF
jgi:hypothetical protein